MLNNLLERKECLGLFPVLRALSMDMSSKSILGRNQLYLLWECMEHRSTLILGMLCSLIWKSIITGGDNSYERIYENNICFGSCFHFFLPSVSLFPLSHFLIMMDLFLCVCFISMNLSDFISWYMETKIHESDIKAGHHVTEYISPCFKSVFDVLKVIQNTGWHLETTETPDITLNIYFIF